LELNDLSNDVSALLQKIQLGVVLGFGEKFCEIEGK
jgi:hypothetical protein